MEKKIKIEYIFLILALIIGSLFVFIVPPFQSPDEDSHFKKAYLVAKGDLYPSDNGSAIGNEVPDVLVSYIAEMNKNAGKLDNKQSYSSYIIDNQALSIQEDKHFHSYSTATVNPIIYAVPALGIIFSKVASVIMGVDVTIPNMLYGARLFSLIFSVLVIFFAIKITPKFKRILFAIALMPMSLFLLSSVSYDSLLISCTALLFAIVMKYVYNSKLKEISNLDLVLIGIIAFIYLNVKYIYSLNLLLLLLIPKDKYKLKDKGMLKKYGIGFAAIIVLYLLSNIPLFGLNIYKYDRSFELFNQQKDLVLHNPFVFFGAFFNSIHLYRFYYLSSFFGTLGLLDTNFPMLVSFIYIVYLLVLCFVDGSSNDVKIKFYYKIAAFVIPVIIIVLAFLAMYVNWTPSLLGVGGDVITGVQGRYFIPALCMLPILFVNKFDFKKYDNGINIFIVVFSVIILLLALFMIIFRFWI